MRKIRSVFIVAALAGIGAFAAIINPQTVLWVSFGMLTFLSVMRHIKFQRMLLALKKHRKNVARIRVEIRAKLHTGFRDYADPLDGEAPRCNGRCSYTR